MTQPIEPIVYQGQFGEFTITKSDRREVLIYRSGLVAATLCFVVGAGLVLWQGKNPLVLLTPLYAIFCLALGVSLFTIHIYLKPLHRALQILWAIGCVASLVVGYQSLEPLALTVYNQPLTILGVGFIFAALTGIFFKEAFCFNRFETKFLAPIIPTLLLGHMTGLLPVPVEQALLVAWTILFAVFGLRKMMQPIPPDIGDKSVFEYLKQQRKAGAST
jgi:uncharacterized integral membrane protein